jgi:hypothetical protein
VLSNGEMLRSNAVTYCKYCIYIDTSPIFAYMGSSKYSCGPLPLRTLTRHCRAADREAGAASAAVPMVSGDLGDIRGRSGCQAFAEEAMKTIALIPD